MEGTWLEVLGLARKALLFFSFKAKRNTAPLSDVSLSDPFSGKK
jgi:hypothetical protein